MAQSNINQQSGEEVTLKTLLNLQLHLNILPSGWTKHVANIERGLYSNLFYWHEELKTSQWEHPMRCHLSFIDVQFTGGFCDLLFFHPKTTYGSANHIMRSVWNFECYGLPKRIDRIAQELPNLPRALTKNELSILPEVASICMIHFLKDNECYKLWLSDDSADDLRNQLTLTLHKFNTWLRDDMVNRRKLLNWSSTKKVAIHFRNKFIELWCSVPYKKGMRLTSIAKQMFKQLPKDEQPSCESQALFYSSFLRALDEFKKAEQASKITPTQKRKQIQKEARRDVDYTEYEIHRIEEVQIQSLEYERRRTEIFKEKYEKQLLVAAAMEAKHDAKRVKKYNHLQNSLHRRASTLLLGVCKSLNQLYKDNKININQNPFTNISSDTYPIVECLQGTPKID